MMIMPVRPAGQTASPSSGFTLMDGVVIAAFAGAIWFAISAQQEFIKTPHRERYASRVHR